mmetsp:Transcript_22543/g.35259  ORF Transcript_22543/g.35259 Transcript_22543/m.35259 type:complete len:418 (+) Transcript_22543:3-1256(+)
MKNAVQGFVLMDSKRKEKLSRRSFLEAFKSLNITNINIDALLFEINPSSPDGHVAPIDFLRAVEWNGEIDISRPQEVIRLFTSARANASNLSSKAQANLHKSWKLSWFDPTLEDEEDQDNTRYSPQPIPVPGPKDSAIQGANSARILKASRQALKERGFTNIAEFFVFVEEADTDQVTGKQLRSSLTALKLEGEVSVESLLKVMGKSDPTDVVHYREFVKHLSWGCRGVAVDAWNERNALESARLERRSIVQAVKRVVLELEQGKRQVLNAQMNEAKAQLQALRREIKKPAAKKANSWKGKDGSSNGAEGTGLPPRHGSKQGRSCVTEYSSQSAGSTTTDLEWPSSTADTAPSASSGPALPAVLGSSSFFKSSRRGSSSGSELIEKPLVATMGIAEMRLQARLEAEGDGLQFRAASR